MRNTPSTLTTVQRDRARGVLLGAAAGDALSSAQGGEWAAGVAMAITVAELAAIDDLRREAIQDRIVERWDWWAKAAKEARPQGSSVVPTAPVALAHLGDEVALATVARAISELAHDGPDTGDAGVLWCAAIRHAVLTGQLDIRIGLTHIDTECRQRWVARFDAAEHSPPSAFTADNGAAVTALQGAWSAIVHTPVPAEKPARGVFRVDHLRVVLEAARSGGGTTEMAAIAGGLLGASYGASAVPSDWRLRLRGWPGLRARDLTQLATNVIGHGESEARGGYWATWEQPPPRRHPHDEQVRLGGIGPLARPAQYVPAGVDAIVSLCPVPVTFRRTDAIHLDVPIINGQGENANLDFVLLDTARAVERLRAEGHTVFLHSKHGRRRAPAVAALYGARSRRIGIDEALADVIEVWPDAEPGAELRAALHRLVGVA